MSNEVHNIVFGNLVLEMRFEGDNYETASVKFKLKAKDGRPTLDESAAIPVKCLFHMAYLIDVSVRRDAIMIEQELLRMQEINKEKKVLKKYTLIPRPAINTNVPLMVESPDGKWCKVSDVEGLQTDKEKKNGKENKTE